MEENGSIPKTTLETVARNFFKEASAYGFKQIDYVRFVNLILDWAMQRQGKTGGPEKSKRGRRYSRSKKLRLPLKGDRIHIRAVSPDEDRELFETWLEDEFGRYFLLSRTTAQISSFKRLVESDSNILGVITRPDRTPVGLVAFLDYNEQQEKAELRKLIGEPSMRGMGMGKEATQLWIAYGCASLQLKKIYLNTFDTNIRNIKLNEELGFRVEGILRNEVVIDGEYKDVLRMGLWLG